jgi:amino acid adenylation domain-containing protein
VNLIETVSASQDGRRVPGHLIDKDVPSVRVAPASFAQERLWFLEQLGAPASLYNVAQPLWLSGDVDEATLRRSLEEIVRRHEALRTRFALEDGRLTQRIDGPGPVELLVRDLRELPAAERAAQAMREMTKSAESRYDLARGPLFRAVLIRPEDSQHVLLIGMHHIVSDAWSIRVLMHELFQLYTAFREGGASPLPDLPIQYADFAIWQRDLLRGERFDQLLGYWRKQLADAPTLIDLPTDRPRPAQQSFRGATQAFSLPVALSQAVTAFGRGAGATLFMTLLAAFAALLHRYCGQQHIVIGAPIANRGRKELEGLIGFLLNTLVLHLQISADTSFRTLLTSVREVVLGAFTHQDLPFEILVDELRPGRSLGYNPLVQVMFDVESALPGSSEGAAPDMSQRGVPVIGTAKFDLSLQLRETVHGLVGTVEYSTDLFDDVTVTRLIGHYETLLASIMESPDTPLARLPWLTVAEQDQIVEGWNDTAAAIPDLCAHQVFEAIAAAQPDAIAVALEDAQVSYAALDRRANQLARHLQAHGLGPETTVGLCLERSVDMIAAVIAVHKAGGCYVPLDPAYPRERLGRMLEDAGLGLVVTDSKLEQNLPLPPERLVMLDRDAAAIARQPAGQVFSAVHPDNLAYVIYTSGSTGQPKGVMISHRGLVNLVAAQRRAFALPPGARILQFFSLSFDISAWEILLAFGSGGTLCLGTEATRQPGEPLTGLLQRQQIDSVTLLPSVLATLGQESLPGLRHIVTGAEFCSAETIAPWLMGRRVFNGYGPTETSVCATVTPVHDSERAPPIGRPILNFRTYVLDPQQELVAAGTPGELVIGGLGLARGYFGQPALTAQRFLPDPFAGRPGARLYRSGDRVRQSSDGQIHFLGRLDRQVKLRGYRIELGDIEAALAAHPAITEAVALVRATSGTEPRLLAFVSGKPTAAAELRAWLASQLPNYMIPAEFISVDAMPRDPNGKLDYANLLSREAGHPRLTRDFTAPRTKLEQTIAVTWAVVLGLEEVSIHENFFDLGGHSLLATRIVAQLTSILDIDLSVRAVFEAPTVAQLAAMIAPEVESEPDAARGGARKSKPKPDVQPASIQHNLDDDRAVVSLAQEWFWFIEQFHPHSPSYNIPAAFQLAGPINVDALRQALNEAALRHETLRTTFVARDGRPHAVIAESLEVPLRMIELPPVPSEQWAPELQAIMSAEAATPFDLTRGPLIRAALVRAENGSSMLLLTLHHIVTDGWSMAILWTELTALYNAFAHGQRASLPELPISYRDYATWQRAHLKDETLDRLLTYWRRQLSGAPPLLELPTDRPRPAARYSRGATLTFTLGTRLTGRINALGRAENATPFMVMLTAFAALLSRYSGQDDVVIGSPIANRQPPETAGVVGLFVNTLALRVRLAGDPSFRNLLARVRDVTLDAYAHQALPFGLLVQALKPPRNPSYNPLFQVLFNLHNLPFLGTQLGSALEQKPEVLLTIGAAVPSAPKFDLELALTETPAGFVGGLEYDGNLFDESTAIRMIRDFADILTAFVAEPDRHLQDIPVGAPVVAGETVGLPTDDFQFDDPG